MLNTFELLAITQLNLALVTIKVEDRYIHGIGLTTFSDLS